MRTEVPMNLKHNQQSPKKPVNLRINYDLIRQAKALNINLSQTLEEAVIIRLKEEKQKLWLKDNTTAIEAYNERVEQQGTFSDGLRKF